MRGRSTGFEVALGKHPWVSTFRDGLMVYSKLYMSQSDALKAAGLAEQAMSEGSTTPDLVANTRHGFEAMNRRDPEAMMRFWAADVCFESRPLGVSVMGRAAVRRFAEDWLLRKLPSMSRNFSIWAVE